MSPRVLILSWEYPPVIEGGLARHVRKLAEALVRQGVSVDVLTRGRRRAAPRSSRSRSGDGVRHRPPRARAGLAAGPGPLRRMGRADERGHAGGRGGARPGALLRSHPRPRLAGRPAPPASLAERLEVPYVTTIHATEHGRHQGWVQNQPQSHIHAVERWMAHRADAVIVCSYYMRGHVADIFGIDERRVSVIPNGVDPSELRPSGDLAGAAGELRRARREARAAGRAARLREGLPARPRRAPRGDRAGRRACASWWPAAARTRPSCKGQAERLGLLRHGTFLGWIGDDVLHSLYRIADLCVVPSIYEPFGLVALEAMASGCPCIVADTGGLREVVPARRARRPALQRRRRRAPRRDDRTPARRRRAARPARGRGLRARAALRLGRHRAADRAAIYDRFARGGCYAQGGGARERDA